MMMMMMKEEEKGEEDQNEALIFRDHVSELFMKCRCDDKEACDELKRLLANCYNNMYSEEDSLVVKGYYGDLLLSEKSTLIPQNEKQGKSLLSELAVLDKDTMTCHHMQFLYRAYMYYCCTGVEVETFKLCRKAAEQGSILALSVQG